jgi:hypothetical protein
MAQSSPTATTSQSSGGNIALTIGSPETQKPLSKKATNFKNLVAEAGYIELDPADKAELDHLLPVGFNGNQLTTALNLYAKGVKSTKLENAADQAVEKFGLSEKQSQSLNAIPYLVAVFEESDKSLTADLQANEIQSVSYQQVSPGTLSSENKIVFAHTREFLNPVVDWAKEELKKRVFDPALNKVKAFAKRKLKKFAKKAIKKIGNKLAKEAVKKGVGIALKAGVKVAAQALGTTVPGIGNVVAFIATEVVPRVVKFLTKFIPKGIRNFISKNKKELAISSILLLGGGVLLGSPLLIAGGIGTGMLGAGAFGAAIAAIIARIVIAIVDLAGKFLATIFGLTAMTAIILLIINNSSYVVPRSPTSLLDTIESRYVSIVKTANGEPYQQFDNDFPQTVTYEITITPRQGSLTNIDFSSRCTVIQPENPNPPGCPTEEDIRVNGEPVSSFPPDPPGIISPSQPYVITYTRIFNDNYENSISINSFTIAADSPSQPGLVAAGRASVMFGNLSTSCPIPNGTISTQSYEGTTEIGHGSNSYWGALQDRGVLPCSLYIPAYSGCQGPTESADIGAGAGAVDNRCHNQSQLCNHYGFAADSPGGGGTPVILPSILGSTSDWEFENSLMINDGLSGWGYVYSSGNYQIFLGHLNEISDPPVSIPPGSVLGSLYPMGASSHVHIELQIDGEWVIPDFLCGGRGP